MDTDGLGLPDEEFNYDEFVKKEFSKGGGSTGIKPIWWITAVILLVAMGIWIYLGLM